MRKGKVGIPSEEHAETNDDETNRGSGFDGGFHCSFTNSELDELEQRWLAANAESRRTP
jgi:hypothetical protein